MKCSLGQCDDSDESINAEFFKAVAWFFTLVIVGGCGAIYWVFA